MKVWRAGEEEPEDHPPIVDDDSVIWVWEQVEEEGSWYYVQQGVTMNGNFGTGWTAANWADLLEEYGPVREATAAEVERFNVKYPG